MTKEPEKSQYAELYHIRNEIVDLVLLAATILAVVAQIFGTLRIFYVGFSPVIIFQNLVMLFLVIITIYRKRIQLEAKTAIILIIIYAALISGLIKFGFLASGKVYLIIAPIFSTFIIGFRKTFFIVLFGVLIYIAIGVLFAKEIIHYDFNVEKYIISPNTWIMDGSILIALAIAIMITGNKYSVALLSKIGDLGQKNVKVSDNENRYRILFENANDGIFIMKKEIFVLCNHKISGIFGVESKDLIGKSPADFSPEFQPDGMPSRDKSVYFINKALNDQPQHFEWLHKRINGELFYAEISLNKLVINDEVFLQAILRDISEKKQVERKILKAIVQAEEREREKFAKELHDGLGPLFSTIKLYTQSAQDETDPKARESVLAIIHDSINEAILSLKEISNNISPHILHNFGLTSAVNAFVDNVKSTRKVNISCSSNTKERFQDIIEFTVYRVLVELINNSVKNAQVKNIEIKIEQADNLLNVKYSDDGRGTDLIDIADKQPGMFNIQNRINSLNGQIKIDENRDKGMNVNILINLEDNESINN